MVPVTMYVPEGKYTIAGWPVELILPELRLVVLLPVVIAF